MKTEHMSTFEGIKVFCRTAEEYNLVQQAMLDFGGKWQDLGGVFINDFPKRAFLFLNENREIIWSDYTVSFINSDLEELNTVKVKDYLEEAKILEECEIFNCRDDDTMICKYKNKIIGSRWCMDCEFCQKACVLMGELYCSYKRDNHNT